MDERIPIRSFLFTKYSERAYPVIEALLVSKNPLVGVLFAPSQSRRLGMRTYVKNILRSRKLKDPALLLKKHHIPYSFTDDHNGNQSERILRNSQADVLLLYGTKIIEPHILEIPQIGVLNSHSALLPKYRGSRSEFWILYNNEPEHAGVTIHWVVPGLDEGDIFLQEPISVNSGDTPGTLREKSVPVTARLFVKTLDEISKGNAVRIPQDAAQATKYKRPSAERIKEYNERRKNK